MDAPVKTLTRKTSVIRKSFKLGSESLNSPRLRRVFDTFDKNGDDMITVDEIHQALTVLGLEADPNELTVIVTAFIKTDHYGLAYDDFVALHESLNCNDDIAVIQNSGSATGTDGSVDEMSTVEEDVESDLSEAFKVFDEDGDGFISAKELQVVLSKLGLPEAQQELKHIQQMISSADKNSDGQVDFFEFKDMMLRSVLVPTA